MFLYRPARLRKHKNPNLYHSPGFYEGLADGTKILGKNTCRSKNPDKIKELKPQRQSLFSYIEKLFTVIVTYCIKDLFVDLIFSKRNSLKCK